MFGASVLVIGLHHVYQYKEGLNPSEKEKLQRARFTDRMKTLIDDFHPTVIADESPDTANLDLLALYPANAVKTCVAIPSEVMLRANLMVARPEDGSLCPYVDDLREKFWERGIRRAVAGPQNARVLMLCGAQHLLSFPTKPLNFVQRLQSRGYQVSSLDLRTEPWWDSSWKDQWVDPDEKPVVTRRTCCIAYGFDFNGDNRGCGLHLCSRTRARRTLIAATRTRRP
jgi:hypothetical protein